ncbi:MAG: NAD(P)-dependent oxidoreductase [Pseudomonadales bacterium]
MSKPSIAFLGLGVMGYPMAGHLAKADYAVTVYNRSISKAESWCKEYSGNCVSTPSAAAANADIVLVCVGNDDDVRSVVYGDDGALASMKAGAVLVDHTTTSAVLARELAHAAQQAGVGFIDAPVSGGQAGAENAVLTIMAGGEPVMFDSVSQALNVYARKCELMGEAGSGQLTKMVNQICIAGLVQGLAEGLNFAELAGLDAHKVVEVISKGAAQSWQMENRYETMLSGQYNHGFAVEWMRKDLAYGIAEAKSHGAELAVTETVNDYYAEVLDLGGARWDTSSLLERLKQRRS